MCGEYGIHARTWRIMAIFDVVVRMHLQNVAAVRRVDGEVQPFRLRVKCKCGEKRDKLLLVEPAKVVDVPNSRGECCAIVKCKSCRYVSNVSWVSGSSAGAVVTPENEGEPVVLGTFECRGLDIEEAVFEGMCFEVEVPETGETFGDVEIEDDGSWCEVDENGVPVMIEEASLDVVLSGGSGKKKR